ncbi:heterokaryon incompatibility protein-domain-containing protein [Cladorrhinum sp. PSN259]|nr:heterokaryon incompatibility protein-domain-containing protein [Cladorrhinum sp. PSN259]
MRLPRISQRCPSSLPFERNRILIHRILRYFSLKTCQFTDLRFPVSKPFTMTDKDDIQLAQEGIPPSINIDIPRVKEMIWNLFDNPLRHVNRTRYCPLCEECLVDYDYQVATYWELAVSAKSGCEMCTAINAAVLEFIFPLWAGDPNFIPFDSDFQAVLYRRDEVLEVHLTFDDFGFVVPMKIQIFSTKPDSPYAVFGVGKEINAELDLESCLDFLRAQLARCQSSHSLCGTNQDELNRSLPARFLYIDTGPSPPVARIVNAADIKGPYIALSHCWGNKEGIIESKTHSIAKYRHPGIPLPSLPKSFLNAAQICQALGINYIWIDSLCIIQDDSSDWEQEAVKMADVYSNAFLTIAVTGSNNPSGGCFFPRQQYPKGDTQQIPYSEVISRTNSLRFPPELRVRYDRICHRRMNLRDPGSAEQDRKIAPLFTRAWGFQERILSRRIIHFHSEEMIWECNQDQVCECGHRASSSTTSTTSNSSRDVLARKAIMARASSGTLEKQENLWEIWSDLVESYCLLDITFESDRLPALAGLGKYLSGITGCTYVAGLWKEEIARQLLWTRNTPGRRAQGVPTWTWASASLMSVTKARLPITFVSTRQRHNEKLVAHPDFTAQVDEELWKDPRSYAVLPNRGRIQVTGRILPCKLSSPDGEYGAHKLSAISDTEHEVSGLEPVIFLDVSEGNPRDLFASGEEEEVEVACLLVATSYFVYPGDTYDQGNIREWVLVLQEVGPGVFERAGVAELSVYKHDLPESGGSCFKGAGRATLTLV